MSTDFRYYNALQDVLGTRPLKNPHIYANTHFYEWDLSGTYAVTSRFDLTVELPFIYGTRKTAQEHNPAEPKDRHVMHAAGVGDLKVIGEVWLFDPKKHLDGNLAVGLGLQAPTGDDDSKDYSYQPAHKVLRPVDPAIEPGTGGWDALFTERGYTSLNFPRWAWTSALKNTYAYTDGIYVLSPQEENGVEMPGGNLAKKAGMNNSFVYDSIPDEFLIRGGLTQVVWPSQGVSIGAGVRWEGVPAHDLIGGSNGWRLPGASASFEPSLSVTHGPHAFTISAPIAFYREAYKGVPFELAHDPTPGLATIAQWQLIVSYEYRY